MEKSLIIEKIKAAAPRVYAAWVSKAPYSMVKIEKTNLLVAGIGPDGQPCACFYPATLEVNEMGHHRVLVPDAGVVRVAMGPRTGLVVPTTRLRPGELAGPAIVNVKITESSMPAHIASALTSMFERPVVETQELPLPDAYKRVLDTKDIQPKTRGSVIQALVGHGEDMSSTPIEEAFGRHIDKFCFKDESNGGLVFSMYELHCRGGHTLLDLSTMLNDTYLLPLEALTISGENVRIDVSKPFAKTQ